MKPSVSATNGKVHLASTSQNHQTKMSNFAQPEVSLNKLSLDFGSGELARSRFEFLFQEAIEWEKPQLLRACIPFAQSSFASPWSWVEEKLLQWKTASTVNSELLALGLGLFSIVLSTKHAQHSVHYFTTIYNDSKAPGEIRKEAALCMMINTSKLAEEDGRLAVLEEISRVLQNDRSSEVREWASAQIASMSENMPGEPAGSVG